MNFSTVIGAALLAAGLFGCSSAQQTASKASSEAKDATSSIVGRWRLNGDTPAPKANLPMFVRLHFKADGTLDASYVAAGGALAHVIDTPSKLKDERDSYTLGSDGKLTIVEGSRALDYTYQISDGKLLLTSPDASDAVVFVKG